MTHLRQAMLEELHRRNYAASTIAYYIRNVEQFAQFFKRSPDRLSHTHLRTYQAYLLRERKLAPRTVKLHVCAIRFFFVKTLKRRYLPEDTPYPKIPRRLPQILSVDDVTRLIKAAHSLIRARSPGFSGQQLPGSALSQVPHRRPQPLGRGAGAGAPARQLRARCSHDAGGARETGAREQARRVPPPLPRRGGHVARGRRQPQAARPPQEFGLECKTRRRDNVWKPIDPKRREPVR